MNFENLSISDRAKYISLLDKKKAIKGKTNVLDFTQYTFKQYQANWHHKLICEKLTAFVFGEIKKLMIFAPPQHGKSELSTRRIAPFIFGINPDKRVILASYNDPFASKFNRQIQRIMLSEEYHDIFPNVKLATNSTSQNRMDYVKTAHEFEIVDHRGSFISVGVGGGISGNPADIFLFDDLIKGKLEANSKTYRDRTWDWYSADATDRMHNDSQQLITNTRWHDDDVCGRILEKEEDWEIITLRAICEADNFDYDPREPGEALWPEKHSIEKLEAKKKLDPKGFGNTHQQQTSPEDGDIFNKKWFKIVTNKTLPPQATIDMWIDGAYTKNTDNDPTGIDLFAYLGNKMLWIHSFDKYLEMPELLKYIKALYKTFKLGGNTRIFIEPKASGKSLKQMLKNLGYNAIEIKGKQLEFDKVARASAAQPTCEAEKVEMLEGAWNEDTLKQLTKFPNTKHDEHVDNLGYAIERYFISEKY